MQSALIGQNCHGFDFYFQVRRSQGRYLHLSASGKRSQEILSSLPRDNGLSYRDLSKVGHDLGGKQLDGAHHFFMG